MMERRVFIENKYSRPTKYNIFFNIKEQFFDGLHFEEREYPSEVRDGDFKCRINYGRAALFIAEDYGKKYLYADTQKFVGVVYKDGLIYDIVYALKGCLLGNDVIVYAHYYNVEDLFDSDMHWHPFLSSIWKYLVSKGIPELYLRRLYFCERGSIKAVTALADLMLRVLKAKKQIFYYD